jgi:succinoglycan biosynthesis protein ExoM
LTGKTITIAIASGGRRTLIGCLRSLAAIEAPAGFAIDLVIADDSLDGRVPGLVDEARPLPFPVRVVASHANNVSVARNASLDAASGDLIALVDDDEWVEPDWLIRLLATMIDYQADCVVGPVYPVYPEGTPDWIVRANPLHVDWGQRGRRVDTGRTSNTLFKRAIAVAHNLRFDPALGRTGGEDTSFFLAYGKAGAIMVVTDDALVREHAPLERVNVAYFRHRAQRQGQMYARIMVATSNWGTLRRLAFYGDAAAKAGVALGLCALLYPFDRARWLGLAIRGWRNVGKVRELLGFEPGVMI